MKIYDGIIWLIVGCITTFTEWVKIELTIIDNSFEVPGVVLLITAFMILLIAANSRLWKAEK
jgi:hypothetical protein